VNILYAFDDLLGIVAPGAATGLVWDPVSGSFVHDPRARERRWSEAVRPLSDAELDGAVRERRAALLRTWCDRLCAIEPRSARDLFAALRVPGTAAPELGYLTIRPPPFGATRVHVFEHHISLWLGDYPLTRADLYIWLGAAQPLERLGTGPFKLSYTVEVPGAPSRCAVLASFEGPDGGARDITMRADRNVG
jgi:hypothetical protein